MSAAVTSQGPCASMVTCLGAVSYTHLDVYKRQDRDRSGYTFEQREGYQAMRKGLITHKYDILMVKDFSRFSRRNSRGLVELEDLRDAGVRIISIGDGIDFPNDDEVGCGKNSKYPRTFQIILSVCAVLDINLTQRSKRSEITTS